MDPLKAYITSTIEIDDEQLNEIVGHFESRQVPKNKHLVLKGQLMDTYYFILSGGLRVYLNNDDKDVTAWLSFENNWLVDIACVRNGTPTIYNIEAIEDTQLLTIGSKQMDTLYEHYPKWQEFGRKLWEKAFLQVVDSMIRHQTLSAEERYLYYLGQSDILQRVPLKQLSSFLGITPSSLSRVRRKIK